MMVLRLFFFYLSFYWWFNFKFKFVLMVYQVLSFFYLLYNGISIEVVCCLFFFYTIYP